MVRYLPSAGTPVPVKHFFKALISTLMDCEITEKIEKKFRKYAGWENPVFFGNGRSCLAAILQSLKKLGRKGKKVILPAYTAESVYYAVAGSGLEPLFVDSDLTTLNQDVRQTLERIGDDTFAIVAAHHFGLPLELGDIINAAGNSIPVIEDAAQAFGSELHGKPLGTISTPGFTSFARGKNIGVDPGGAVRTSIGELHFLLRKLSRDTVVQKGRSSLLDSVRNLALQLLIVPEFYAYFHKIAINTDRNVSTSAFTGLAGISRFNMNLLAELSESFEKIFEHRHRNGMFLYRQLENTSVRLPRIPAGAMVVWNRLPILLPARGIRDRVMMRLAEKGISSAPMYSYPLDSLVTGRASCFPGAREMCERLLALPVWPGVTEKDMTVMVETVRNSL